MPNKTRRELREETIKKAYFQYWKFQNNPDYIEFYNENFTPQRLSGELYTAWADRVGCAEKMESVVYPKLRDRFKLSYPPVDPFKKINWLNFNKILLEPDREILVTFKWAQKVKGPVVTFFTVQLFDDPSWPILLEQIKNRIDTVNSPFCFIPDHTYDKKEILETISKDIDEWEKMRFKKRIHQRDSINKFHLYAQVWDLRKGQDRKSFLEIARMMGAKISTTKSRFYRAFELIFNQPFDTDLFRKSKDTVHRGALGKYCEICSERETCKDPCPDIIPFIMQDWKKGDYRELQAFENNPKVKAHLGLDK